MFRASLTISAGIETIRNAQPIDAHLCVGNGNGKYSHVPGAWDLANGVVGTHFVLLAVCRRSCCIGPEIPKNRATGWLGLPNQSVIKTPQH